ncbi:MAG TPA: zf-HC2 domain-containing protein [Pseudonocardia sp.]|nr:zf-HC2 domain-containing protein [Pseudonocardia sp.]
MTGSRRFSLSSPDWGQAHLTLDAIVAYVDDELGAGAHARAEAHLRCCGECRTEVVAQRQARAALRDAGGPCLPSNLLRSLRSIPVETELPPMPPGLGVTADGQFVLLRDASPGPAAAPCDHRRPGSAPHHPDAPPAGLASGPSARRFSRRARYGAVSGIALSALTVGALATPSDTPAPTPQSRVLGGAVLDLPARLSPPSSNVPTGPTLAAPGASTSPDPAVPAVLDAQLRDRLNRIPAAFRPDQ